jgi:hypothetical protein
MSNQSYNTNLASEFYVLSALHRLGLDAVLTLGNKKSVDLSVVRDAGDSVTVDVKGLAGKTGWPVDNATAVTPNHFLVFVCYCGKIEDIWALPEVWVIPSTKLMDFVYNAPGGRKLVQRAKLLKHGQEYRNAWSLIVGHP